ncbi:MAG TPA: hypothetical protein VHG53_04155 [Candidatus Limnocylindria bacterium]|nr:hypothetical protein [Candidatus Limnocylindria bacterium]
MPVSAAIRPNSDAANAGSVVGQPSPSVRVGRRLAHDGRPPRLCRADILGQPPPAAIVQERHGVADDERQRASRMVERELGGDRAA